MTAENAIVLRDPQALADSPPELDEVEKIIRLWLHGRSRHTQRAYRSDINRFRKAVPKPIETVTLGDLQNFADHLKSLRLRPGSQHRILAGVKSFFAYAHRLGLLKVDAAAALRMPSGKGAINERILPEEEVMRMIEVCESSRDRQIVEMLYYCALRVGELVTLTWRDTSPRRDGGQITVIGKGDKRRAVRVPDFLWEELTSVPGFAYFVRSRFIFPLSVSQVGRIIAAAAIKAGIGKPVSPHWLRHCHASHALEKGEDLAVIQATLGHSNISTTSEYLHARPERSSSRLLQRPPKMNGGNTPPAAANAEIGDAAGGLMPGHDSAVG